MKILSRTFGLFAATVVLIAIVVLSVIPGSMRPHSGAPGGVEHLVTYAICAALLSIASRSRNPILIIAGLATLAAALEVFQASLPGRNSQFVDIIWSTSGSILGVAPWVVFRNVQVPEQPP